MDPAIDKNPAKFRQLKAGHVFLAGVIEALLTFPWVIGGRAGLGGALRG
jgi:hypothetical protein